jgi:hypothetical protein
MIYTPARCIATASAENCTVHFYIFCWRALPSSGETKRARQVHMNITAHSGWLPLPHMKSLTAMLSNSTYVWRASIYITSHRQRTVRWLLYILILHVLSLCVSFFPTAFVQMCIYICRRRTCVCVPLCGTTAGGKDREEQQQLICILCDCERECVCTLLVLAPRALHVY